MSSSAKVLVVDDEEEVLDLVADYLGEEDFEVLTAPNGAVMRQVLAKAEIDLIVLDVKLPDQDGFSLVRELRKSSDTPVILLTGKADTIDRIVGLEIGADDYVAKPFELRELLARIRSVLRRTQTRATLLPKDDRVPEVKVFAGWLLDEVHRQLFSPAGLEVELTAAEFALLRELVNNPQRPVGRNQLLLKVQSREWSPEDRSIDVSISRLRRKMEADPNRPMLIKTIRNSGYVLASKVSAKSPETGPD